jgi:hypothetical protein
MTSFKAFRGTGRLLLGVVAAILVALALGATPAMAEFSLKRFAIGVNNQNGTPDVQAGSHPYSLTTTFVLNAHGGSLKDASVELPPGFIGNPDATPKCSYGEFAKQEKSEPSCASDTAVGVATVYLYGNEVNEESGEVEGVVPVTVPIYNLAPPTGVVAEFGFIAVKKTPVLLTTSVRTGTDYGLTTTVSEVNQAVLPIASKVTIWGVPASPEHNLIRGECEREIGGDGLPLDQVGRGLREGEDEAETPIHRRSDPNYERELDFGLPEPSQASEESDGNTCALRGPEIPLLTNPTACGAPRTATLRVDSWEEPKHDFEGAAKLEAAMPEITGCGSLDFSPTIDVTPEKSAGSTPSGLEVDVRVPQESIGNPDGQAEATVRDTTVAMPAGLQLNPSSAGGREACSEAQVGFTGFKELDPSAEPGIKTTQFEPTVENPETKLGEASICPLASKVANVRIKTPVLEGELEGGMYLASPQNFAAPPPENPFESLLALYLVAEEPKGGVIVKLPGKVTANETTGQLTASFEQTPSLPFSDLHVEFYGGERASLSTPALCDDYETAALLTPWSSSTPTDASSSFQITSGPNGGACASNPLPFAPSLTASTQDVSAGAFSALSTTISREDGQQSLHNVTVTYPPGVSAVLTGVPLCPEVEANAGTCGSGSQIGEASASAGVGTDPYTVTGGKVYLTGPYDGAPFGVSIVTPAVAGPFNLGNVIVRAKLEINPTTAAVTVTTTGEIPHILDGIPLQLKHIRVTINRPNFTINPTNCEPMSLAGTVGGTEGAASLVSDPFQVGNCGTLKFQPTVAVTTGAHSSKKDGASLDFKISYPSGSIGSEAWFKEAKFVIPKQLPAELKTIQQACLAATFEANPANCPVHSKIGEAVVHTPVLPVPLTGPVYFVSYGSAKFPDAVMLLSGDNVNVRLTGETYIHEGITSATFPNTPDVPFESVEVDLPTGEYSEFGTNLGLGKYDFCGQKLTVPTEFKAQNGLEIHEETPVSVTGCPSTISVRSLSVKKRTLTLTVYVPAAGKLAVSGKGLPTKSKAATGQQLLTVSLTPKKAGRLRTKIKLLYTPAKGSKQTKTLKASFKR